MISRYLTSKWDTLLEFPIRISGMTQWKNFPLTYFSNKLGRFKFSERKHDSCIKPVFYFVCITRRWFFRISSRHSRVEELQVCPNTRNDNKTPCSLSLGIKIMHYPSLLFTLKLQHFSFLSPACLFRCVPPLILSRYSAFLSSSMLLLTS